MSPKHYVRNFLSPEYNADNFIQVLYQSWLG